MGMFNEIQAKGPGYGWLHPEQKNKTQYEAPEDYSPFYYWKEDDLTGAEEITTNLLQKNKKNWEKAVKTFTRNEQRFTHLLRKEIDLFLSTYFDEPLRCVGIGQMCLKKQTHYIIWYRKG